MEIEIKLKEHDKNKYSLEVKATSPEVEANLTVKELSLDTLITTVRGFLEKGFRSPPPSSS